MEKHGSHITKLFFKLPIAAAVMLSAAPAAMAQSSLEEVVVTAQRRMESVLNVPITVKVISGEDLTSAGVSSSTELTQTVPAFRFDNNGAFSQPSIRGVGTALANVGGGSAVGIYVDGFLVPSPLSSDFSFLNVSGVEVLKGPQGTLFGRNTTAGAVLVSTTDPSFEPRVKANASYANYNQMTANFYGSSGLTDTIAVDLAVMHQEGDGFVEDIVTGDDDIGENEFDAHRLGILFNPNDDVSVLFRYTNSRKDDPKAYLFGAIADQDDAFGDLTTGALIGGIYGTSQGDVALNDEKVYNIARVENYTLTADIDLGWAALTSRTMYRNQRVDQAVDLDSTNINLLLADIPNDDKTKTQEFLLSGDSDRLEWVTGVFWMNEVNTQDFSLRSPSAGTPTASLYSPVYLYDLESEITSFAIFGDATYEVVDDLYLVFGVRYSNEENEGFWRNAGGKTEVDDEWEDVSPRFVVRYQLNPDSSVYASWSKGFKAGLMDVNGFNPEPIDPEEITAYEVGFKTQTTGTRLEASAFYYDYQDLQVSSYVGTYSFTTNAASTEVYGGEVSFLHQFTDSFSLSGGLGYTHGEYDSYPTAPYHERILASPNPLEIGTFTFTERDAKGNQMQRAPEWTGNLTATYVANVADGELELTGNVFYTDEVFFDPANQYSEDAYALLNLRAAWTEPSGHWTFAIFGNNVTNEEYINQVLTGPLAAQQTYGDPAVYGLSVSYQN